MGDYWGLSLEATELESPGLAKIAAQIFATAYRPGVRSPNNKPYNKGNLWVSYMASRRAQQQRIGLARQSVWKEPQTGINKAPKRNSRVFAKCAKPLIFNKSESMSSRATNRLL